MYLILPLSSNSNSRCIWGRPSQRLRIMQSVTLNHSSRFCHTMGIFANCPPSSRAPAPAAAATCWHQLLHFPALSQLHAPIRHHLISSICATKLAQMVSYRHRLLQSFQRPNPRETPVSSPTFQALASRLSTGNPVLSANTGSRQTQALARCSQGWDKRAAAVKVVLLP